MSGLHCPTFITRCRLTILPSLTSAAWVTAVFAFSPCVVWTIIQHCVFFFLHILKESYFMHKWLSSWYADGVVWEPYTRQRLGVLSRFILTERQLAVCCNRIPDSSGRGDFIVDAPLHHPPTFSLLIFSSRFSMEWNSLGCWSFIRLPFFSFLCHF